MQIILVDDYAAMSREGAELLASKIKTNPELNVVLATGNSPVGLYKELAAMYEADRFDTSRLTVFQLDDYLGLHDDDHRSLFRWLDQAFIQPLDVAQSNVVRLTSDSADPDAVCRAYDEAVVRVGGLDFALLGLGPNGHLGFNEPPSEADAPSRTLPLTQESIASSAVYWDRIEDVPASGITAGLGVLLGSKEILIVVSGEAKRDILLKTLTGPITPDVPASFLQQTPNVTIIVDRAAWTEGLSLEGHGV